MAYNVEFNGVNLSDYCTVLNIKRSILPPRTNYSKSITSMNGSFYTGFHYGEKEIVLEIYVNGKTKEDYMNNVRRLANVLNVERPSKLVTSDEPDKYYYAVIDGTTDLDKTVFSGTASITFICHDPVAYSEDWESYTVGSKGIVNVINNGTTQTDMIVDVDFNNNACFFQMTNNKKETVLIGAPKDITKENIELSTKVVNDICTSSGSFTSISENLLDSNRKITGSYGVGLNGNAIIAKDYGTSEENKWTGCAFRKSIGKNLDEFEVVVDFVFSSDGKNYVAPKPAPPVAPPNNSANLGVKPPSSSLGTYKVVNCGGLWINSTPSTSGPLYAMAPGTYIYPTEIQGNWAKHTHSNRWNTFTGWSSMKYLQKVSDNGRSVRNAEEEVAAMSEYAEDQVGLLEIYGFGQNGEKIFKAEIQDSNEYYEFVQPSVYLGNTKVLSDSANCPTPRKVDGNSAASGVHGDWNDLDGKLIIRREKNSKGVQLWTIAIYKYVNGKCTKQMVTANSISNSKYPNTPLNYIGFYMGRYDSNEPTSVIAIKNVSVERINGTTDTVSDTNKTLFKDGDHLQINFQTCKVTKNGTDILNHLDIGTEFFKIDPGVNQIAVRTDDNTAAVVCGIQKRYL